MDVDRLLISFLASAVVQVVVVVVQVLTVQILAEDIPKT